MAVKDWHCALVLRAFAVQVRSQHAAGVKFCGERLTLVEYQGGFRRSQACKRRILGTCMAHVKTGAQAPVVDGWWKLKHEHIMEPVPCQSSPENAWNHSTHGLWSELMASAKLLMMP